MHWTDVEEITEQLDQTYPDVDPLSISLTHLQRMIIELPDFQGSGNPPQSTALLRIQREWNKIRQ